MCTGWHTGVHEEGGASTSGAHHSMATLHGCRCDCCDNHGNKHAMIAATATVACQSGTYNDSTSGESAEVSVGLPSTTVRVSPSVLHTDCTAASVSAERKLEHTNTCRVCQTRSKWHTVARSGVAFDAPLWNTSDATTMSAA